MFETPFPNTFSFVNNFHLNINLDLGFWFMGLSHGTQVYYGQDDVTSKGTKSIALRYFVDKDSEASEGCDRCC